MNAHGLSERTPAFAFDFSADRVVCVGAAGPEGIGMRELGRNVAALRRALPPHEPQFVVSCRDRYWLLVACLAAWGEGRSVVFAANDKPAALDEVFRISGARTLLSDGQPTNPTGQNTLHLGAEAAFTLNSADSVHAADSDAFSVEAERIVATLFTSGTSGEPQRVEKTARQLLGEAKVLVRHFGIDSQTVLASTVPPHHLYGLLFSMLVPYLGGGRFVRDTPFQPAAVLEVVERWGVTELVTVPAHLRVLLPGISAGSSLRRVFSSGAVLEPGPARDFVDRSQTRVVDVLGSTESGGIATREPAQDETYRPLPSVLVEQNSEGTLLLTSPFLEDPTQPVVLHDRVTLVPGGFRFDGRNDGVLKIAGNRVSVQDLERVAKALPNVRDAAIVVVDSTSAREREPWLLLASSDASWTFEAVREALLRHFDAVVLPRRLRVVAELPRNALGKLERKDALALFDAEDEVRDSFQVPADWVFFEGHFRDEPLLPGVAQLCAVVLPRARAAWPELGAATGIKRVKFKRPILPSETLLVRIRRKPAASELWFELSVQGETAAVGTLTFEVGASALAGVAS